jgi:hypothetical protein
MTQNDDPGIRLDDPVLLVPEGELPSAGRVVRIVHRPGALRVTVDVPVEIHENRPDQTPRENRPETTL